MTAVLSFGLLAIELPVLRGNLFFIKYFVFICSEKQQRTVVWAENRGQEQD